MHVDVKRVTGLALVAGLLTFGVAASPAAASAADPRPLVEIVEELAGPDRFFVSPDDSTVFVLNSWGEGNTIDTETRQITGSFPAIDNMGYLMTQTPKAQGPVYPIVTYDGYALFDLATRTRQQFVIDPLPGESYPPSFTHIVANAAGDISAITAEGEYLTLNGATVTSSKRIRDEDGWPSITGVSTNGNLYFETYYDPNPPYSSLINVIDMSSGEVIATLPEGPAGQFDPLGFDVSEDSLWGTYFDDPETLVNLALPSGEELGRTEVGPNGFGVVFADSAADWFIASGNPTPGGGLGPDAEIGARDAGCCLTGMYRMPENGDVIYYDVEMRRLGFITAPSITHPVDAVVDRLGDTVMFTSDAEGLALTEDEPGAAYGAPFGAIWQSSPDGETWTDIPGETNNTLTRTVNAETYPLQYRRHFLDPFWGKAPSSSPAKMQGKAPEITRADDLPNATKGSAYPSETITATGQSDMVWSSGDLPAGLTLDAQTGAITGTPTASGASQFTVTVTDVFGTHSKLFNLKVTDGSVVPPGPGPKPGPGPTPKPVDPVPPSPLAHTGGFDWAPAAGIAALLVAAGASTLLVRRKSRTASN